MEFIMIIKKWWKSCTKKEKRDFFIDLIGLGLATIIFCKIAVLLVLIGG